MAYRSSMSKNSVKKNDSYYSYLLFLLSVGNISGQTVLYSDIYIYMYAPSHTSFEEFCFVPENGLGYTKTKLNPSIEPWHIHLIRDG